MELQSPVAAEAGKKKRFFRKRDDPFSIIARIKLWPSRKGILHGLQSVERVGNIMTVITHCNKKVEIKCSRNGRLARWLRNKWYEKPCPECMVPDWKLQKYSQTAFIKGKKYGWKSNIFKGSKTAAS